MARDNREVERTLLSKFAFTSATAKGVDHRWLELGLPDLPPIYTKFSHTREDIGKTLWTIIAKQLHVTANYLSGMIDCSNSKEDYYGQVRTDPQPPWTHLVSARAPATPPLRKKTKARKK